MRSTFFFYLMSLKPLGRAIAEGKLAALLSLEFRGKPCSLDPLLAGLRAGPLKLRRMVVFLHHFTVAAAGFGVRLAGAFKAEGGGLSELQELGVNCSGGPGVDCIVEALVSGAAPCS